MADADAEFVTTHGKEIITKKTGGNMPDPKEGPPTLRECKEKVELILILAEHWMDRAETQEHRLNLESVCYHMEGMRDRLTDEALERDEKRKITLLRLFYRSESQHSDSSGKLLHAVTSCVICESISKCREAEVKVFAEPYALAPGEKS